MNSVLQEQDLTTEASGENEDEDAIHKLVRDPGFLVVRGVRRRCPAGGGPARTRDARTDTRRQFLPSWTSGRPAGCPSEGSAGCSDRPGWLGWWTMASSQLCSTRTGAIPMNSRKSPWAPTCGRISRLRSAAAGRLACGCIATTSATKELPEPCRTQAVDRVGSCLPRVVAPLPGHRGDAGEPATGRRSPRPRRELLEAAGVPVPVVVGVPRISAPFGDETREWNKLFMSRVQSGDSGLGGGSSGGSSAGGGGFGVERPVTGNGSLVVAVADFSGRLTVLSCCPEGANKTSPGQRPGSRRRRKRSALKGRNKG